MWTIVTTDRLSLCIGGILLLSEIKYLNFGVFVFILLYTFTVPLLRMNNTVGQQVVNARSLSFPPLVSWPSNSQGHGMKNGCLSFQNFSYLSVSHPYQVDALAHVADTSAVCCEYGYRLVCNRSLCIADARGNVGQGSAQRHV